MDSELIKAKTVIVESLCSARDLIKQSYDSCIGAVDNFTLDKANLAIHLSSQKTYKYLIENQELPHDEDTYATALITAKLLDALSEVITNKCQRRFQSTTWLTKQAAQKIVYAEANQTCTEFAAKVHELFSN